MGQVALGFRSLLIKLSIFFVMAALLAWALGGTLSPKIWPRPTLVDFDGVMFGGSEWYWQLAAGGRDERQVRWTMMSRTGEQLPILADDRTWVEVAGPLVVDSTLYYAGRASFNPAEPWRIARIEFADKIDPPIFFIMPDRLAVERQLARIQAGFQLQTSNEIQHQRAIVLDPPAAGSTD